MKKLEAFFKDLPEIRLTHLIGSKAVTNIGEMLGDPNVSITMDEDGTSASFTISPQQPVNYVKASFVLEPEKLFCDSVRAVFDIPGRVAMEDRERVTAKCRTCKYAILQEVNKSGCGGSLEYEEA